MYKPHCSNTNFHKFSSYLNFVVLWTYNFSHDIDEHLIDGEPIWVKTRSNHWSGPFKWSSIQHGVDVTVWRRYSAPQPLTKDILIVHILVSPYTASNPWLTDCVSSEANSWLLNIFKLQPGGILHTYILSKRNNTYLSILKSLFYYFVISQDRDDICNYLQLLGAIHISDYS